MSFTDFRDIPGLEEYIQDRIANILGKSSYDDAANTYDFAAAAQAACVAQTITNGVTTSAPSQDAVFDALALKQNAAAGAVAATVITATEQAAPASPDAGFYKLYVKSDGKLYIKNSGGTETVVGTQS